MPIQSLEHALSVSDEDLLLAAEHGVITMKQMPQLQQMLDQFLIEQGHDPMERQIPERPVYDTSSGGSTDGVTLSPEVQARLTGESPQPLSVGQGPQPDAGQPLPGMQTIQEQPPPAPQEPSALGQLMSRASGMGQLPTGRLGFPDVEQLKLEHLPLAYLAMASGGRAPGVAKKAVQAAQVPSGYGSAFRRATQKRALSTPQAQVHATKPPAAMPQKSAPYLPESAERVYRMTPPAAPGPPLALPRGAAPRVVPVTHASTGPAVPMPQKAMSNLSGYSSPTGTLTDLPTSMGRVPTVGDAARKTVGVVDQSLQRADQFVGAAGRAAVRAPKAAGTHASALAKRYPRLATVATVGAGAYGLADYLSNRGAEAPVAQAQPPVEPAAGPDVREAQPPATPNVANRGGQDLLAQILGGQLTHRPAMVQSKPPDPEAMLARSSLASDHMPPADVGNRLELLQQRAQQAGGLGKMLYDKPEAEEPTGLKKFGRVLEDFGTALTRPGLNQQLRLQEQAQQHDMEMDRGRVASRRAAAEAQGSEPYPTHVVNFARDLGIGDNVDLVARELTPGLDTTPEEKQYLQAQMNQYLERTSRRDEMQELLVQLMQASLADRLGSLDNRGGGGGGQQVPLSAFDDL